MAPNATGWKTLIGCGLLLFAGVFGLAFFLVSRLGGPKADLDELARTSATVIERAEVLTFDELAEHDRRGLPQTARYSVSGGWGSGCCRSFEAADGFYVRAAIDPFSLALLSFLSSCGSSLRAANCREAALTEKIENATAPAGNRHALYGKYKNSWHFSAQAREIPSTRKFEGHTTMRIERYGRGRLSRDSVLVGPLPERPTTMVIQIYHGLTEEGEAIPQPTIQLAP